LNNFRLKPALLNHIRVEDYRFSSLLAPVIRCGDFWADGVLLNGAPRPPADPPL
jgi:hypothetical protein